MAKQTVTMLRLISIALIVVGIGFGIWAYQISGSMGSQLSQTLTGSHSDKVMTLYISGAVSLAIGLFLFLRK